MMFTSMAPVRRQKDPRPYRVVETGARVDSSAFGTPGVTLIFDPRPEFIKQPSNPVNQVLDLVRDHYVSSNSWGSSMVWLSIVAEVTKKISGASPSVWRTDLPTASPQLLEQLIVELGVEAALPQLLHAGHVLQRLADASESAGKSYMLERLHDDDESD